MHPYRTLKVPLDADSETIRQAYLAAIRRHPPEHEPERFRLVEQAYAAIKSEDARHCREIGGDSTPSPGFNSPLAAMAAFWKADLDPEPPTEKEFLEFLRQ
jgi:DnaJ-class molecular chaperone